MTTPPVTSTLIRGLRLRDPEVLASTVREHALALYRAARGMGFREEEAEDLVQDVFLAFLASLDRFEGRSQLCTWLFGILHHKILERRRAQDRYVEHDPIDEVFESRFDHKGRWRRPPEDLARLLESRELGAAIGHCMAELPASQRVVFALREVEGLATEQICRILRITATNMSVLIHRAKIRLRECLESMGWGKSS